MMLSKYLSAKSPVPWLALIIAAVVFTYFSGLYNGFIDWDDYIYILNNKGVSQWSWSNLTALYQSDRYISLTLASFALQIRMVGYDPFSFHLVNLVLHCLNCLLVYLLIRKLSGSDAISLITAALFALHPTRVESVAWVMQRKDLLYSLFYLSSLIVYITFLNRKEKQTHLIFLVFLLGWLSVVSKIQGLTLPFVLLLFDYYYKRKVTWQLIVEKLLLLYILLTPLKTEILVFTAVYMLVSYGNPLRRSWLNWAEKRHIKSRLLAFYQRYGRLSRGQALSKNLGILAAWLLIVCVAGYFAVRIMDHYNVFRVLEFSVAGMYHSDPVQMSPAPAFSAWERVFLFCYAIVFYLYQAVFPFDLSAMHPYPERINGSLPWEYYGSALIIIVLVLLMVFFCIRRKNDRAILLTGLMFFTLTISMVGHIIPIEGRVVVSDRYAYLAYLGIFFPAANYFVQLRNRAGKRWRNVILPALLVLLFTGYAGYSMSRVRVWKDSFSFWEEIIRRQPENYYAWFGAGNSYLSQGRYEDAAGCYHESLRRSESDPMVFNNLGLTLYYRGKYDSALACYDRMLLLDSASSQGYNNRGNTRYALHQFDQALKDYSMAIRLWPDNTDALLNRADLESQLGSDTDALRDYLSCIRRNPENALAFYHLGLFHLKRGNREMALKCLDQALLLEPGLQGAGKARKDAENRSPAIGEALEAAHLKAEALISQGLSKASSGDYNSAVSFFDQAIGAEPNNALAYKNRGNARAALKDFTGAIRDYDQSIALDPTDAGTFLNRGNARYNLNMVSACDDWDKAYQMGNAQAGKMFREFCEKAE